MTHENFLFMVQAEKQRKTIQSSSFHIHTIQTLPIPIHPLISIISAHE
jgi:hypothetical protein